MPYRHPALDEETRRHRTLREAEILAAAKRAGVLAPHLYFVDPLRATLVMEAVEGDRMKDKADSLTPKGIARMFSRLGSELGKLHNAGIVHGDLTTANIILRRGALVFLDFGLSSHSWRVEDRAVDLRLIKETLTGAHSGIAGPAFEAVLSGYAETVGRAKAASAERQLSSIERRGRYARVE